MITMVHLGDATLQSGIVEYRGLSTDTKPTTNVKNGSQFIEMNTGKAFLFNEATSQWVEV